MNYEHEYRSLKEEQPSSEASEAKPPENESLRSSKISAEPKDEENSETQTPNPDHGQSQGLLLSEEEASSSTPSFTGLSVDSRSERDDDSAIGDTSVYTTSTSVRSSVYQFIQENGRTYHSYRDGKYHLPNDEREQDRLDLQHHLFLLTLSGELYNAPIKDLPGGLHNVLDIATGTGIWAIDFATEFPSAHVIGTDLSPIQPEFIPSNCHFEVDDAEDPWLFPHKFDYIHGRALATCFRSHIPVIQSAFTFLRPGGYLELQDCIVPFRCIDDTIVGTTLERWVELIMAGTAKLGKDWTRVKQYKQYLEEAGFEDVVERRYEWPVGTWAKGKRMKTLGMWYREDLLSGLQGFTVAVLTRGLGMSVEEVELLLVGVREDIKSNRIHIYIPVRVVYGRKPH